MSSGGPPGGRPAVQTSRIAVGASPPPCADLQQAFGGTPAAAAAGDPAPTKRGVDYSHIAVDRSKPSQDSLQDVLMGSSPAPPTPAAAAGVTQASPEALADRERRLEARSDAQGSRWLDPGEVAAEPATGYGKHHHIPQTASPDVQAALAKGRTPAAEAGEEAAREARAMAQGGRWLEPGNMPRGLPRQEDQPEVVAAQAHAREPAAQDEEARKAEARSLAQGGRW